MENKPIIRNLDGRNNSSSFNPLVFFLIIIVSLAIGTGIGFFLSKQSGSITTSTTKQISDTKAVRTLGIDDKKTFKDSAEGILKEGGIGDEGSYHLVRPGGDSQNVYLTSSTVDLSQVIEKKIRVWGQTNTSQKAGWLMDVGYVEVLQ